MNRVTDPRLLAQLEGKVVVDPALLAQLEAPDQYGSETARLKRTGETLGQQYRAGGDHSAPPGIGEELLGGGKHAWDRAALGLKGLVTDLSPADRMLLEQGKGFVAETGPASTVGQVGTDIGMSLGPIGAVNRGLTAVRGASALPASIRSLAGTRYAAPVADIAANAGYSAGTAPENRGDAALYGGAGAAAGWVLNRAVSGLVKPSASAQELLEQGVRLTPGQAGGEGVAGSLARIYEQGLGSLPVAGNLVSKARQTGLEDWNRHLTRQLDQAAPYGIDQTLPVGSRGLEQAREHIGTLYQRAFPQGQVLIAPLEHLERYDEVVQDLVHQVSPGSRAKFNEVSDWIKQNLKDGVPADQWKEVITGEINGAIRAAERDGAHSLARSLTSLGGQTRKILEAIGGPKASVVKELDQRYAALKALEDAAAKAGPIKRGGVLYPSDVAVSAAKRDRSPPLLEQALKAQELFGSAPNTIDKAVNLAKAGAVGVVGHTVVGGLTIPAVLASLLGTTELGRKFLLGQITWQQFLAKHPGFLTQLGRVSGLQDQQHQE